MELVQDLLLTASFALILSFLVAKLLAMAVTGRESEAEFVKSGSSGGGAFMEEVRFEEKAAFRGQRRVHFAAGEVKSVDQFGEEPVRRVEEVEEPPRHRQEVGELTEEVLAVGLPEKSSDGEEKMSVEKEIDSDRQRGDEAQNSSESRGDEEIGAEPAPNDVVASQSEDFKAESAENDVVASRIEEARVLDCNEATGKAQEGSEVKLENYSDDDWEGIEKSELDDEFTAAVNSDGR